MRGVELSSVAKYFWPMDPGSSLVAEDDEGGYWVTGEAVEDGGMDLI